MQNIRVWVYDMGVLFSFNILGLKGIKTKGCGNRKAEQEGEGDREGGSEEGEEKKCV